MSKQPLQESAARVLIESGAVGKVEIFQVPDPRGERWGISFSVGIDEYTVSSCRAEVRLWSRINSIAKWLKELGIEDATLKIS